MAGQPKPKSKRRDVTVRHPPKETENEAKYPDDQGVVGVLVEPTDGDWIDLHATPSRQLRGVQVLPSCRRRRRRSPAKTKWDSFGSFVLLARRSVTGSPYDKDEARGRGDGADWLLFVWLEPVQRAAERGKDGGGGQRGKRKANLRARPSCV